MAQGQPEDPMYINNEDIYTAGDESPKPSAPLDIGKLIIKVDWTGPFSERWRARLHVALQTWLSRLEENASVHSVRLMDDKSCAEVQITPSAALESVQKLKSIRLKFKNENKEVTAWICQDEAHARQKSMLEENEAPLFASYLLHLGSCSSSKTWKNVNTSVPLASAESNFEEGGQSKTALNDTETNKTDKKTPVDTDRFTLPLYEFWYMQHAYRKELEQFEKQHGVSICPEVSISIRHIQGSSPDSVSKTSEDFMKLIQGCMDNFSQAVISHDMDSDVVKDTLFTIQTEEAKMMFTMTASNCLLFGPKKYTDLIKKETTNVEHQFKNKLLKNVFDVKKTRREKLDQKLDFGAGAAKLDKGLNFRKGGETDYKGRSGQDSKDASAYEETCVICMDSFTDKERLKCGHEFCRDCLKQSVDSIGSICPICKEVFGKLEGNQPEGTMSVSKSLMSLPGYPHCGSLEIYYDIPSGIQTDKHPNPGKPYNGTTHHAYLPDNQEGNDVLALLFRAFQQHLIFTVRTSTTTGIENAVTWNDIHHKTNIFGGPQNYGYPDPDYLKRVKNELKAKGIE